MTVGSFRGTAARVLAMVVPGAVLKSAAKADRAFSVWSSPEKVDAASAADCWLV